MEGVEEALARIGGNAYLMDAVTTMSTGAIDLGEKAKCDFSYFKIST